MQTFVDYYVVLGISPLASQEAIHAAYRRIAKRHHPDVAIDGGATRVMQLINEAYAVLGDPRRRAGYDGIRFMMTAGPRTAATSGFEVRSRPSGRPPEATGPKVAPAGPSPHGAPSAGPRSPFSGRAVRPGIIASVDRAVSRFVGFILTALGPRLAAGGLVVLLLALIAGLLYVSHIPPVILLILLLPLMGSLKYR